TLAAGIVLPAVALFLPHRPDWPPLTLGTASLAVAASALGAGIVLVLTLRQDRSTSRSHLRHRDEIVETSQSVIGALVSAAARVLGAVERFETLLAGRGGPAPTAPSQALAELRDEAGTVCDPEVVALLITTVQRLEAAGDARDAAGAAEAGAESGTDPLTRLPAARQLFSRFAH